MAIAIRSASASIRLHEARKFLDTFSPGTEVLLLGASRGAVDDLARTIAMEKGATFGLHRLSFTQLAARLAAAELAANGHAPSSALGYEAVAARAAFEANKDEALDYFSPVSSTPGFPKALARTLQELRLAGVTTGPLAGLLRSGPDLSDLLDRVETLMAEAGASDRASLFATAAKALKSSDTAWPSMPVLLLDVPFESEAEAEFLWTLIKGSPKALVTVPDGDMRTIAQLEKRGVELQRREPDGDTDLTRLARHLFSAEPPPERERSGELVWFSAPGEGRECVEIARRILKEAANDIRFDEIAILIRSPQHYVGVLGARAGAGEDPGVLRSRHQASASGRARIPGDAQLRGRRPFREAVCRVSFARAGAPARYRRQSRRYVGGVARRGVRRFVRKISADSAYERVQQDAVPNPESPIH